MYLGYEKYLFMAHRVVKFFVWSDVITFLLQAGGGGMSALERLANIGKYVSYSNLIWRDVKTLRTDLVVLLLSVALPHGSDTSVDIFLILLYNLGAMGISRVCCS